ncbi:pilus assembly protein [Noviherbaspirillum humi]|nr:PilC/PilY family type IV pilus protein [Noviherbaspirillum humi]
MRKITHRAILAFLFAWSLLARAELPTVDLSQPAWHTQTAPLPNLLLGLALTPASAGAVYTGASEYDRGMRYEGYFNPDKCYAYSTAPLTSDAVVRTPSPAAAGPAEEGYFYILKNADARRECGGDSFAGNFMNWATASKLDLLRMALTGGDRVIDTLNRTVLQRAVLPADPAFLISHFPPKRLAVTANGTPPDRLTPFRSATLHIASCRHQVIFSDKPAAGTCTAAGWLPEARGAPMNAIFQVRVQACDGVDAVSRPDLCQRYGSTFKPVGALQRNAQRLRYGVISTLPENGSDSYGGVLRAPMKQIGPMKNDRPGSGPVPNEALEWDPDSGVFRPDPDRTGRKSGVVNYINLIGRDGIYPGFNPLSELVYEGTRLFQGRQPSVPALKGIRLPPRDGFPAAESWTDPVSASCQSNDFMLIANAGTSSDRGVPGNSKTDGRNRGMVPEPATTRLPALDAEAWLRRLAGLEINAAKRGRTQSQNGLTDLVARETGPAHGSFLAAGLAYWASQNDIRLDRPVRFGTRAVDLGEVADADSNVLHLAAKYGGGDDMNGAGTQLPSYLHVGPTGGRVSALQQMVATVGDRRWMVTGAASDDASRSGTRYVYEAGFQSGTWQGSLTRRTERIVGDSGAVDTSSPDWDAGRVLTEGKPEARKIYIGAPMANGGLATLEFSWSGLPAAYRTFLNRNPGGDASDGLGRQRLDWLRGAQGHEVTRPGGIFRARQRLLGDIIGSKPAFVGKPSPKYGDAAFADFMARNGKRASMIYVGANDGMLHGFDAVSGEERMAYIPAMLAERLPELTRPDYRHQSYVDGPVTVEDLHLEAGWKTILVASLGAGGQGVFALDVTDPDRFGTSGGALWEFSDRDDPDMGNLLGPVVIGRFNMAVTGAPPIYRHFAMVASGVNAYANDGSGRRAKDAKAALFLLSLDKEKSEPWRLNRNYFKLRTTDADETLPNGLSTPALVAGADGATRLAYAGDLQGNLWRFDFDAFSSRGRMPANAVRRIFTAVTGNSMRQPISSAPAVVYAPNGGYVVLIGTGKLMEARDVDPADYVQQSLYAVLDVPTLEPRPLGRSDLAPRAVKKSDGNPGYSVSGPAFRYGGDSPRYRGWYIDLPDAASRGERSIHAPAVLDGKAIFNTVMPGAECGSLTQRLYYLDALSGLDLDGRLASMSTSLVWPAPPLLLPAQSAATTEGAAGRRLVTRDRIILQPGAAATGTDSAPTTPGKEARKRVHSVSVAGRLSWRELINWGEGHHAASTK